MIFFHGVGELCNVAIMDSCCYDEGDEYPDSGSPAVMISNKSDILTTFAMSFFLC